MLIWLTSLYLSLQEYLYIAEKYGLHPVSIAIGLILLLSHSVSVDMFFYVVINFYSFCDSCKFLIEILELYKSVLDIMEVLVALHVTNQHMNEHYKFNSSEALYSWI